jgi:cytochrome c oxidase subunit 1
LYIIIKTIKGGKKASDKVWEGATGLEFEQLPSPPPYHSFTVAPEVK